MALNDGMNGAAFPALLEIDAKRNRTKDVAFIPRNVIGNNLPVRLMDKIKRRDGSFLLF